MQWVDRAKQALDGPPGITFVAFEPSEKVSNGDEFCGSEMIGPTTGEYESLEMCATPSEDEVMSCCEEILNQGFETIVGLSLGRYGCPFLYVGLHQKSDVAK
jgi:hypothetical protein